MINFIYAKELKKEFVVRGSFYSLEISSNMSLSCRNQLEIFDKDYYHRPIIKIPDAITAMMNPGGSEPLDKNVKLPKYKINEVIAYKGVPLNWVLAKPDITQYQIMRLMHETGWKYVRVINLSDIREPKSKEFKKILEGQFIKEPHNIHSIFSKHRSVERTNAFNIKNNAPIILAWGTDEFLIPLAKMCFTSCDLTNAKGIAYDDDRLLYYHASPTLKEHKERWLENMLEVI